MRKSSYVLAEEPGLDLVVLQAVAAELDEYLVSDELYRTVVVPLSGGTQSIQMTGADLLTRLHRLCTLRDGLKPHEQSQLDALQHQVRQTIAHLNSRFQLRLQREIRARLDSLRWFLDDCETEPQRCHIEFPFEMRNRQRVEEALKEIDEPLDDSLKSRLESIDKRIRDIALPSPFVWDDRLQPAFPRDRYWFLYLRPPRSD